MPRRHPMSLEVDRAAVTHFMEAFCIRELERMLRDAHRQARYNGVAFSDPSALTLAERLKKDRKNTAARRRRVMEK